MPLDRFRRWLQQRHILKERVEDLRDDDPDVQKARRRLEASSRLVSMHANKSAKALRRLNRILTIRARALESIGAAESALSSMDQARDDK